MKLLLDTNIFLEVLLAQDRAEEARALLSRSREQQLYVSDYSVHSVGTLLFRRNEHEIFQRLVEDVLLNAGVEMLALSAHEMGHVADAALSLKLDFDDAYQYSVAEEYDLEIVSFDADFDRTKRGRKTPAEVMP